MIEILTSGATLGVHVPGLLLADRLRERHSEVRVSVLERLLPPEKLTALVRLKRAYHHDHRFAQASRRLGRDTAADLDAAAVDRLWRYWAERGVRRFVVFSGHWLPVLRGYREFRGGPIALDLCRGDARPMHSFLVGGPPPAHAREVNLADLDRGRLPWTIPVTGRPPTPWSERDPRLLVHGGGWGLGTYRDQAAELAAHGLALDLVAYEPADVTEAGPWVRHFLLDPEWHPWHDDGYPPMAETGPGRGPPEYRRGTEYPYAFGLARRAIAVVSKPGAGTLLDSLWAATPLVMLEPWTESERANAALWERLGFGIPFARWRDAGFAPALLDAPHQALRRAAPAVRDYAAALAAETASVTDRP